MEFDIEAHKVRTDRLRWEGHPDLVRLLKHLFSDDEGAVAVGRLLEKFDLQPGRRSLTR